MKTIRKLVAAFMASTIFFSAINVSAEGTNEINMANDVKLVTSAGSNEFRAVWFSSVYNRDWVSSASVGVEGQKNDYVSKLEKLKESGFNAVIFQVRAMGDALYPSAYATWSKYLTGTLGKDPGYDPLEFALQEAHKRNMEFHAWFNPFRISSDANFNINDYISRLPNSSALKQHPEWIVKYSGSSATYHWINLGIPEARQYVIDTILEVVGKYGIDGVHLDDYFYPYPVYAADGRKVDFPDGEAYEIYKGNFTNKEDWRRNNVNLFVKELSEKIRARNSSVKFGISPFGIWKNGKNEGGAGTNGMSSYYDLYVDSKAFIDNQWIDYIVPQVYWSMSYSKARYDVLVDWWSQQVAGKNVQLYIGQAAYKISNGSGDAAWNNSEEIINQVKYNRNNPNVKGSVFFSASDILANKLGVYDALKNALYNTVQNQTEGIPMYSNVATISSFTVDKASPQKLNSIINFYATVSGSNNPLYRYSINNGSGWQIIQDYSTKSSLRWIPNAKGTYTIRLEVKDANSPSQYDDIREISFVIKALYTVTLDPGHGGSEIGAISLDNDYEKNINLPIALTLRDILESRGLEVYMTRDTDKYVSLSDRAQFANNLRTDIFVSVHNNSYTNQSVNGIETFYYSTDTKGKEMAEKVQKSLIANTKANNRGAKSGNYLVIRETIMPAILVECGFITNREELNKLKTKSYQDKLAYSIAYGVLNFLNLNLEDVNRDSSIDLRDLAAASAKYNTRLGDSAWSSNSDVNNDNIVDIFDLVLISKQIH
ncbi:MAG: family 10 glycosylhydrolase [Clostridiales bacterium]|uniref:family 10 glycosylhydrolase n=1 Tax=Clostridium sp. N3C TaxID=1776758 RepID=UPI00092E1E33|nr:family 10 glycosylhydrolase [Clostridium sp. N3C]NLZ47807.1 family 10 glycosylhydrolase [Clostridiales bacterium]SCN23799.1 N-acetylmuramoyl-L-alanine amidase LytC precursor [Clostridium sp. N3C]